MHSQRNSLISCCTLAVLVGLTGNLRAQQAGGGIAVAIGADEKALKDQRAKAEAEAREAREMATAARVAAATQSLEAARAELKETETRYQMGMASATEVAQSKGKVLRAEAELAEIKAIAAGSRPGIIISAPPREAVTGYEGKLRGVMLPRLDFVDAPLAEALKSLSTAAAAGPQKFQVSIVNTLTPDQMAGLKLTVSLQNVSLYDALRYVTQIAGVKLQVEENVVILSVPGPTLSTPPSAPRGAAR